MTGDLIFLLAARRLWFRIHQWIGLLLAIVIVPVALSGAALVWGEGLDRLANPRRYATTGTAMLPLARYVAAGQAHRDAGERVANLVLPAGEGPVTVTLVPTGEARGRRFVHLDPPTARVLDVASSRAGLVRFLHRLHGSLLVPGVGRQIVGWIGVALMLSSLTGLWLWWPTVGRWVRGLRWRRHAEPVANLHYLAGFWIALPLFVLALSGAWISFPRFFGALAGEGAAARPRPMMLAPPLERPALGIDAVVAAARPSAPDAPLRTVILPTMRNADWTLSYDTRPLATVTVADDSGTVAPGTAAAADPGVTVARLMRRLHGGTGMGLGWQVVIFLAGPGTALLAVTGVLMWRRTRGARGKKKRRAAS